MATEATKELILDAAERLFAERGFDSTSLRTITSEAEVNLAAIHYHFGSKDALIQEVLYRRLEALNRQRLLLLDACESGDRRPQLEEIVRAFIAPPLHLSREPGSGGASFMRLMGYAHLEPGDHLIKVLTERCGEFVERFSSAFRRALPEQSHEEVAWQMFFMLAVMAHTMAAGRLVERLPWGHGAGIDTEAMIERVVTFVVGGMRAATATAAAAAAQPDERGAP